jgi:hypothetical protein
VALACEGEVKTRSIDGDGRHGDDGRGRVPAPMHARRLLPALLLLAVGCDDGGRRATPALQPSLAITAANAVDVAGTTYHTAFEPVRIARIAAAFFEVAPPTTLPAGPLVVQEVAGPEGGTAVWTWHDRDGDELYSSGDEYTVAFAGYGESGRVLTGVASFSEVFIDGDVLDGLTWIVTARLQLLGLQVAIGDDTTTVNGLLRFAREKRATVRLLSLQALDDVAVGVRTLHAGSEVARNDYALDFSMGLFATGTLEDPLLGGVLSFRTETPMTGVQVLPDPSTGAFAVTGTDGSALTVVPLDFFTLEIQVDENGDGEVDVTLPGEWAAL